VVYSDRAINHMSEPFKEVMTEISTELKSVYNAHSAVIVPGSGTYAMEAVARQYGSGKKCMVMRNGYFSYRWSQIFEAGSIPSEAIVVRAQKTAESSADAPQFAPLPLERMQALIAEQKPEVLFAPHVETSSGILLPDEYVAGLAKAMHDVGGIFVLDCIASGTLWVDMGALGADVVISAPQKGWTGPSCAGLAMLSERAHEMAHNTASTSFSINLKQWLLLMESYENGGFMYHTTMPTDALVTFRDVIRETKAFGYDKVKAAAWELGSLVRSDFTDRGLVSVAAEGFKSPGVVVVHTTEQAVVQKFISHGTQVAAGVPLMIDEGPMNTFRIGLFGLDKMMSPALFANNLKTTCDQVLKPAVAEASA